MSDTLYWHSSSGGQFTCKSAYLLALETNQETVESLSDKSITFLRSLWKARVPNKIKLFVWRAWNNYVPTVDNLRARALNLTSVSCTLCGNIGEEIVHVLFKCSMAKEVWDRSCFGSFYATTGAVTFEDFCHVILDKFPSGWEVFLMTLWSLWTRRNKHFHGQPEGRGMRVDLMANKVLMDYHKANQKELAREAHVFQTTTTEGVR